jgi:tRNA-2-methylthio-N6-dimethylallyladenosine synthase
MKVYIETYGCQMNEYDSNMIRSMLVGSGHALVADPGIADAVLVNTCSVRERAQTRVLGRLRHLRGLMKHDALLGVVGCVAQQMGEKLFREIPRLDLVVGTDQYALLPDALDSARPGTKRLETDAVPEQTYDARPAPTASSLCDFVSIMRGCDNYCSYCVVPYVRGRERSREAGTVLREMEALAALGTRDVTLKGQNVNSYMDGDVDFADLLRRADGVRGLLRIRFATSHPKDLTDDLITAIAELPRVCEHVHLPVQSGSDRVLQSMNRSYTRGQYVRLVERIRSRVPGAAITTDIIVGFPGETSEDFEATLSLMREVAFDSAFMFRYSVRTGTAASRLPDDVPTTEKLARLEGVIELQKRIAQERNESFVGTTVQILAEGPSARDPGMLYGRARSGRAVVAPGPAELAGRLLDVTITGASAWTLRGERSCSARRGS